MSNIYQLLKQKGTLNVKHAARTYDHNSNNEQQESSSSNDESQISFARILDDTNDDDFVGPKHGHHRNHKVSSSHQHLLAMMGQENVVNVNSGIKGVSDDVSMRDVVVNDRHPNARQSDDDKSVWDDSHFMEISVSSSGAPSSISSLSEGPAAPLPVRVGGTPTAARTRPSTTTTTTTCDHRRTPHLHSMDVRHGATYEYYRELQRVDSSHRFGRRTTTRRSHTWTTARERGKCCHPHDIDIVQRRPSLPEVISTSRSSSSSSTSLSSFGGHENKVVSMHTTLQVEEDEIVM